MDGLTLITIVFFVLFALRVPIAITLIVARSRSGLNDSLRLALGSTACAIELTFNA